MQFIMSLVSAAALVFTPAQRDNAPRNDKSLGRCAPGVHQERATERAEDRAAGEHVTTNRTYIQDFYCEWIDGIQVFVDPELR